MISRNAALPGALVTSLLLASSTLASRAAEAGAWETFSTTDNAAAWLSYDYFDNVYYTVDFENGDPTDPFISSYHVDDIPIDFSTFTALNAGEGKLVGDYAAAGVQGVEVDVFVPSLPNFLAVYLVIYVNNPDGTTRSAYEAYPYFYFDLGVSGWHRLRFGFDETWSHYNGTAWVDAVPGDQFFTDVDEISFIFIPTDGTSGVHTVGIDNVKLEPKVVEPVVTTSVTAGGNFTMSFVPGQGVTCSIEQMALPPETGWVVLGEHFDITGTVPYVFSTPTAGATNRGFYRVNYDAIYTPFVTPPEEP